MEDNGGSAFPLLGEEWSYGDDRYKPKIVSSGMTLRDYFAAKALPAIIAGTLPHSLHMCKEAAQMAYAHADAMLEVRQ